MIFSLKRLGIWHKLFFRTNTRGIHLERRQNTTTDIGFYMDHTRKRNDISKIKDIRQYFPKEEKDFLPFYVHP